MQRLWSLDSATSSTLLARLLAAGVLRVTSKRAYVLASTGD